MFQCWTLYEKCSEVESGVENKFPLINMNFLKKGLPDSHGSVFHRTSGHFHNSDLWNRIYKPSGIDHCAADLRRESAAAPDYQCCIENPDQGLYPMPAPYLGWRLVLYNWPCWFPRTKHLCAQTSVHWILWSSAFGSLFFSGIPFLWSRLQSVRILHRLLEFCLPRSRLCILQKMPASAFTLPHSQGHLRALKPFFQGNLKTDLPLLTFLVHFLKSCHPGKVSYCLLLEQRLNFSIF